MRGGRTKEFRTWRHDPARHGRLCHRRRSGHAEGLFKKFGNDVLFAVRANHFGLWLPAQDAEEFPHETILFFEKLRKMEYERVNRSIYREVNAALPPTVETVGFRAAVYMMNIGKLHLAHAGNERAKYLPPFFCCRSPFSLYTDAMSTRQFRLAVYATCLQKGDES